MKAAREEVTLEASCEEPSLVGRVGSKHRPSPQGMAFLQQ